MSRFTLVELPNPETIVSKEMNVQLDPQWHVLHTRSRQEKILARELCAAGTTCCLPLIIRENVYAGLKANVEVPLFPGYVFVCGTLDEVEHAKRTGRVASITRVAEQKRLAWELRNLCMALSVDNDLHLYPVPKRGMRVEVMSGPLMGVQGLIEDGIRDLLILRVEVLGQAISVELDGAIVSEAGDSVG